VLNDAGRANFKADPAIVLCLLAMTGVVPANALPRGDVRKISDSTQDAVAAPVA